MFLATGMKNERHLIFARAIVTERRSPAQARSGAVAVTGSGDETLAVAREILFVTVTDGHGGQYGHATVSSLLVHAVHHVHAVHVPPGLTEPSLDSVRCS